MEITGARALVKALELEGVSTVFGYPGGAVVPLYEALRQSKIQHVLVRHEPGAIHAANGYARASGKVGVCIATSGPGATNLVTGIATAYMDSVPVVVITGQVPTTMVGTDAFQEVDITGITMPITKHNFLVKNPADIPAIVKKAFYIASTGRPGPVLIDLPKDVASRTINFQYPQKVEIRGYKPNLKGHPQKIAEAVKVISQAKRPVIIAGGGIIAANASQELYEFAVKADIPVTNTLMGLTSFPQDSPLFLGMLGLHGTRYANLAVTESDILIALGVRFADRVTGELSGFAPKAKIIHIDVDPAEIGKNVRADVPIVGDVKNVLQEMLKLIEPQNHQEWLSKINSWKEDFPLKYEKDEYIKPQETIKLLGEKVSDDTIIATDVGQHQMWTAQFYPFRKPRTFLTSGGLGCMGYGLPAAIGAAIAFRDKQVVLITGDGSFQMNMGELATAREQNLSLKIILFVNRKLGMVKQLQEFYANKNYFGIDLGFIPDFVALAKAYGIPGRKITKPEEVDEALNEMLGHKGMYLLEVEISPEEKVLPMVLSGAPIGEAVDW
ncbi:biosynthetic-type acetolactate synthase large subunit [Carboxydothermus pertinax]|uniref:Acetolactate synthase n=1 Tax=Carboxydothermus pertinax TaxID=870242 RepID=A0A1L8CU64_9THEO|nr:biosynthetic-type acetolactate synthase large subunit [Carboxydothermus pertinax]GAV22460.1 acetolactate synthase, large subunit, biosynthetic type [Carboxydothermus pertinax]